MPVDLRIAERDWSRLRNHCASSFRSATSAETGALGLLGRCRTDAKEEFIVTKVVLPGPGDLKTASSGEVVFDASYIRRVHLETRRAKLTGIAAFHTHPFADATVRFSPYDDAQEPKLVENLRELAPTTQMVSVVVGKQSQCGRVYSTPPTAAPLRELIVVGDRLSYLPLNGLPPPPPPAPAEIFDRGLLLTGSGALNRLSRMTVVVVGASGTGSLICELLARAGCKHIILIDHDVVRLINLNRILHATRKDAENETPKVHVLKRAIEAAGLGCRVEPVFGTILDRDVLRRILDADIVFGCVDRDLPRFLLCEAAYQYLLPYIDLGSEIGGDHDGIVSLDSRVSYVAPGRHCLTCSGIVTPRRLHFESLTESERRREIALGYSDDLQLTQPAVMDLNMGAARQGMIWLRHLLQPFLREPLPVRLSENAVTYKTIPVSAAVAVNPACPTCQTNRKFGFADCAPPIGYDSETVRQILGDAAPKIITVDPPQSRRWRAPHFLRRAMNWLNRTR